MEEIKNTPTPLTLNGGWEQQVSENAKRHAADRERELRYHAEEEARRQARKQANRTMVLFCVAMALIAAGGALMNYVGELPLEVSAYLTIGGTAMFFLALGIMIGRRHR